MKNKLTDKRRGKTVTPDINGTDSTGDLASNIKSAILSVQQLILLAQRELVKARKIHAQAERYLQETETKARSEAQKLILQTRMTIRKDTEKLMRQANAEIEQVLADIHMIRLTAQEELAAQKKFTDAARLRSFTLSLQKDDMEIEDEMGNKPAVKKQSINLA